MQNDCALLARKARGAQRQLALLLLNHSRCHSSFTVATFLSRFIATRFTAATATHTRTLSTMTAKTALPFGSWPSPITPSLVLSSSISLIDLLVQPRSSTSANTRGGLLWLEGRPEEKGRQAIVFQAGHDGNKEEVLPADTKWNARTRVHEYGGASVVWQDANTVLFSSMEGPVYSVERSRGGTWSEPKQVTQGA